MNQTPNIIDVVEFQLPENIRTPENAQFIKLIKYYYQWLTQSGQPTDFIQNIIKYRDIDLTSAKFKEHLIASLINIIPTTAIADKNVLTKKMADFLKSKGSIESFQFIMNAVYGEDIQIEWNSNNLLRASANEFSRKLTVAIESGTVWSNVIGSTLIQTSPTPASASIIATNSSIINGVNVNWLELNPESLIGKFEASGSVECIHNNINRAWFRETFYYTPVDFSGNTLRFTAIAEEPRPYNNLVIKQLNSNFRCIISAFNTRTPESGDTLISVSVKNVTGTLLPNQQLYIFAPALENLIFTNENIEYGIVSNSVVDVNITNGGALYANGERISFQGGSGELVNGFISEVSTGSIESVDILHKGYGYTVGDKLRVIDENSAGSTAQLEVSAIDGVGAKISPICELNTYTITNGGNRYKVGDILEVTGGSVISGTTPAQFQVSSINNSWAITGVKITSVGSKYPAYTKLALVNVGTKTLITGFTGIPSYDANGGIALINLSVLPAISSASIAIIANGGFATATPILTAGVISSVTLVFGGVNYVDPIVTVTGNGVGANILPIVVGGVVTGFTIVSGGTGYTTATLSISERYGSGFNASLIFRTPTSPASGSITGVTLLNRGLYTSIPNCFNNKVTSVTGIGMGDATFSLNYRVNSLKVDNSGQYYHGISTESITGTGTGVVLAPQLSNGVITGFTIVSGGTGYTKATISVSNGIGFSGVVNIIGGVISSITILNGGSFYSSSSAVTITGNGTSASLNLTGTGNISNGVLSSVPVINGGSNYFYGTTITCNPTTSGAVAATLTPVISNGVITSVTTTGGSGYILSDFNTITISSGTTPSISATVSGTGKIIGYTINNAGTGFYTQSEITPLTISTGVVGSGAKFIPTLNSSGSIVKVAVIDSGTGYDSTSTISVSGGGGSGAVLRLVTYNGIITNVIVVNKGLNYKYGTSAIVLGNGAGASITPIIETGITSVNIISKGIGYVQGDTITVTDSTGTGADIRPVLDGSGAIVDLLIINKGIGYTSPSISITTSTGTSAVITANANRHISSLNITSAGSGYSYADVIILGDGVNADISLTFDKLGSIDTCSVTTQGSGITSTPTITVIDNSGYGAVSGINIISGGSGYSNTPVVILDNKVNNSNVITATGAKFITFGSNIGKVKKVSFDNGGAQYTNSPTPIFPLICLVTDNAAFIPGETVRVRSNVYTNNQLTNYILLEDGSRLLLESGGIVVQDIDDVFFDSGVTAVVRSFDFDRNILKLELTSDIFNISTEDVVDFITEDGFDIVSQTSGSFNIGDTIVGLSSGSVTTIKNSFRANGDAVIGGNNWSNFKFNNNTGMLNNKLSVIADNNRYQDYAYVVKAGRALSDYEALLKSTVHPAGFALFGDVVTQSEVDMNMFNEIGYNPIVTMLYILSMSAIYQSGSEWSDLASLYGDLVKFNLPHLSILNIASYGIQQVSDIAFANCNIYPALPLIADDFTKWNIINSASVRKNYGTSPIGDKSSQLITDSSAIAISSITTSVPCAVNDTLILETYISVQTNAQTFVKISMDGNYIYFNPSTGLMSSTTNTVLDIIQVASYWFVRIKNVATTTSMTITITPSFGFVTTGISDITAIGSVEMSKTYVKNITGISPVNSTIKAVNSMYSPTKFYALNSEAQITIS